MPAPAFGQARLAHSLWAMIRIWILSTERKRGVPAGCSSARIRCSPSGRESDCSSRPDRSPGLDKAPQLSSLPCDRGLASSGNEIADSCLASSVSNGLLPFTVLYYQSNIPCETRTKKRTAFFRPFPLSPPSSLSSFYATLTIFAGYNETTLAASLLFIGRFPVPTRAPVAARHTQVYTNEHMGRREGLAPAHGADLPGGMGIRTPGRAGPSTG